MAITLRYLATGDSSKCLQYGFRVAYNTICLLIPDVCQAIVDDYHEEVIKTPTTPQDWMVVANQMGKRWQYHHCLASINGKHVAIRKLRKAGSYYFNYKNFPSIVLMALVDGDYKFIWVDVGYNGTSSDAQIFEDCELKHAIDQDVIGFPPADHLPDDDKDTPYIFVGDDAFRLRTYMMKPYGEAWPGHHPTKNLQLQNQPLQESVRKCLWHPGQSIWLSIHYHEISARYSLYHCPCCHMLPQPDGD